VTATDPSFHCPALVVTVPLEGSPYLVVSAMTEGQFLRLVDWIGRGPYRDAIDALVPGWSAGVATGAL
jgi:hypothetical protein